MTYTKLANIFDDGLKTDYKKIREEFFKKDTKNLIEKPPYRPLEEDMDSSQLVKVLILICVWFFGLVTDSIFVRSNFDVVFVIIMIFTLLIVISIVQSNRYNKKLIANHKVDLEKYNKDIKEYEKTKANNAHQNYILESNSRLNYENGDCNVIKPLFKYMFKFWGFVDVNDLDITIEKGILRIKFFVPDHIPNELVSAENGNSFEKKTLGKDDLNKFFWETVSKMACRLAFEVKSNLKPFATNFQKIIISGNINAFEARSGKVVNKEILNLVFSKNQIFQDIHFESKIFNSYDFTSKNNKSKRFGINTVNLTYHVENRVEIHHPKKNRPLS